MPGVEEDTVRLVLTPVWLRGLEGGGGRDGGRVWIRAVFEGTSLESNAVPMVAERGGVGVARWHGAKAEPLSLVWEVPLPAWTRIMSVRPLLRINVVAAPPAGGTPAPAGRRGGDGVNIGYALLDLGKGMPKVVPRHYDHPLHLSATETVSLVARRRAMSAATVGSGGGGYDLAPGSTLQVRLELTNAPPAGVAQEADTQVGPHILPRLPGGGDEGDADGVGVTVADGAHAGETTDGEGGATSQPHSAPAGHRRHGAPAGYDSEHSELGMAAPGTPAWDDEGGNELDLDAIPIGVNPGEGVVYTLAIAVDAVTVRAPLPPSVAAPPCWCSYKLFGVLLQSHRFHLHTHTSREGASPGPIPIAMTDVFSLRSTAIPLQSFLAATPPLPVYIATDGKLIASTAIPLHSLSSSGTWASDTLVHAARSMRLPLTMSDGTVLGDMAVHISIGRAGAVSTHPPSTTTTSSVDGRRSDVDRAGVEGAHGEGHHLTHTNLSVPTPTTTSGWGGAIPTHPAPRIAGLLRMTPLVVQVVRVEVDPSSALRGGAGDDGGGSHDSNDTSATTDATAEVRPSAPPPAASAWHLVVEFEGEVPTGDVGGEQGSATSHVHQHHAVELAPTNTSAALEDSIMQTWVSAHPRALVVHVPTGTSATGDSHSWQPMLPFGTLSLRLHRPHRHGHATPSTLTLEGHVPAAVLWSMVQSHPPGAPPLTCAIPLHEHTPASEDEVVVVGQVVVTVAATAAEGTGKGMGSARTPSGQQPSTSHAPLPPSPPQEAVVVPRDVAPPLPALPPPAPTPLWVRWPPGGDAPHRWRLTLDARSVTVPAATAGASTPTLPPCTLVIKYAYDAVARMLASQAVGGGDALSTSATHATVAITSSPPVGVAPGTRRLVPNAAVTLAFAAPPSSLLPVLAAHPVVMDVMDGSSDRVVGSAVAPLDGLAQGVDASTPPPVTITFRHPVSGDVFASWPAYRRHCDKLALAGVEGSDSKPHLVAMAHVRAPITLATASTDDDHATTATAVLTTATIEVVAYLEDGGEDDTITLPAPPTTQTQPTPPAAPPPASAATSEDGADGTAGDDATAHDPAALRSQLDPVLTALIAREEAALAAWRANAEREWLAAKVGVEEAWRKEAEAAFQTRVATLEAAWAQRETERQATVAAAQESIARVEARLRKVLAAAEGKEREVERAAAEHKAAVEAKSAEMNALARRLREDAEHTIALAKQREAAAAQRAVDSARELAALRDQYDALRTAHEALTMKNAAGPDAAVRDALLSLQSEVDGLRASLASAREEVGKERAGKEEARVQVLRLAREVARLREAARQRDAAEAHRLRVAYVAAEERYTLEGDRAQLRDIRRQVDAMVATSTHAHTPAPDTADAADVAASAPGTTHAQTEPAVTAAVAALSSRPASLPPGVDRLKLERQHLVASAPHVYTASHPAIQDLDRRIALAKLGVAGVAAGAHTINPAGV